MKKFRNGKKFGDLLTVLLILLIIGIIALLCFFGYEAIQRQKIEDDAAQVVEEFYKTLDVDEEEENDTESTADLSNFITENNETTTDSTATRTKTYYNGYEVKGTISISKTGIEYPILDDSGTGALAIAIGILEIETCDEITETVSDLNVKGTNAYLLGHNLKNGQFFSDNDQLELGDTIDITDQFGETITYTIYNMYYTTGNDVTALTRQLDSDVREITLQTCNDDSSQRLIIYAKDS